MRIAVGVVVLVAGFAAGGVASAQTTVGGAVGVSTQAAGDNDLPYLGPPFSGTSAAFIGLVDHRLGRLVTIGGEASLASAISGDQFQRAAGASNTFTSRHRDSVFSGTVKFGLPIDRGIHAAFVAGAGAAMRRTARDGTTASLLPPATHAPYSATLSNVVFAYTLGGDVDVRLTRRTRLLVLARWHRLRDDDRLSDGVVKRGVASSVFRAAVGATWRF